MSTANKTQKKLLFIKKIHMHFNTNFAYSADH